MHGLLAIDKPAGLTSHDVVGRVRRILGERKVGHSGTLDPDATGVLVVGVGNATRLLRFVDVLPGGTVDEPITSKEYTCDIVLGTETSTLDASGEVTATHDMSRVVGELATAAGRTRLDELIGAHLTGRIMQVPPMVSALKVDGRRLHELAREGIEVEREARPVTVHAFTVERIDGVVIRVKVRCSSGTYIRSLGESLGRLLGGGAHIRDLRRVAVGSFDESDAVPLDQVSVDDLRPVVDCVRGLTAVAVDEETERRARLGQVLPEEKFASSGDAPWALISRLGGEFIAVYEPFAGHRVAGRVVDEKMARPVVVTTPME